MPNFKFYGDCNADIELNVTANTFEEALKIANATPVKQWDVCDDTFNVTHCTDIDSGVFGEIDDDDRWDIER